MDPLSNIVPRNLQIVHSDGPESNILCNPRDPFKSILERLSLNPNNFLLCTEDELVLPETICGETAKVFLYPRTSKNLLCDFSSILEFLKWMFDAAKKGRECDDQVRELAIQPLSSVNL